MPIPVEPGNVIPLNGKAPEGPSLVPAQEPNEAYDCLFDFNKSMVKNKQIISQYGPEITKTINRRKLREIDVDPQELRDSGDIDQDETLITIRTIDTNIKREQPPFLNFLRNSRRLATFKSLDDPSLDTQLLEDEFTRGMTYSGWEEAYFTELDGSQVHGWDAVEVVFDESKPLHVGLEHVGHDDLLIPLHTQNIQYLERLTRRYQLTVYQLKVLRDNPDMGFDRDQLDIIIKLKDVQSNQDEHVTIYKQYFKWQNQVYVCWFADQYGTQNWLKAPVPLYLGIRHKEIKDKEVFQDQITIDPMTGEPFTQKVPVLVPEEVWVDTPIRVYPIFVLKYNLTESKPLTDLKGRAFLDYPKQEALTALWSSMVNGSNRATNVYGAPAEGSKSGAEPRQLDTVIEHGKLYSEPIEFFSMPYPELSVLAAAQALDVQNSQEVGQLNFAVQNKTGSRNTATEVEAAAEQNQLLNSVQLTLFSTHIREVVSFEWLIVQSQALQDKIKFLQVQQDNGIGMDGQAQTVWVNNHQVIGQKFELRAAGDVDVIQRSEELERRGQFWPIVATTPIAPIFLADMLRLAFPKDGDRYAQALMAGANDKALIASLAQLLKATITPQEIASLPPDQQQVLQQLAGQVQQSLSGAGAGNQPQPQAK